MFPLQSRFVKRFSSAVSNGSLRRDPYSRVRTLYAVIFWTIYISMVSAIIGGDSGLVKRNLRNQKRKTEVFAVNFGDHEKESLKMEKAPVSRSLTRGLYPSRHQQCYRPQGRHRSTGRGLEWTQTQSNHPTRRTAQVAQAPLFCRRGRR